MTDKILFVDDDANLLAATKRQLRKKFALETACNGPEGLETLKTIGPFAVVISDMQMPKMNGLEFLKEVETCSPDTVRIMLTGNADQKTAVDAINQGSIFRFCTKPCPPEVLGQAMEAGIAQYRLITAERVLLERTLGGSVKVLIDILSLVDPVAFGKATRLKSWAAEVARKMDLPRPWELDLAAMLSPIGQLTVPDEITEKLRAKVQLSLSEQEIIDRSPEIGRNLIANIPRLKNVSEIVYYQNKGFGGGGFPKDSVSNVNIPIGARILKILIDLNEVVGENGPDASCFNQLEQNAGRYDPEILPIVRSCLCLKGKETKSASAAEASALPISQLRPEDMLMTDIRAEDGSLVLAAGHELSTALLAKLRNWQKIKRLEEPVTVLRPSN